MTITTCDICKTEIPLTQHHFPSKIESTARLENSDKTFSFELNVTRYQFTTTNFAVCKMCMIKAVKRAVENLVESERIVAPASEPTPPTPN